MKQLLFWLPLSLFFMVSPEYQTILGNSVGLSGAYFYPLLCVVAGLAFLTIRAYSLLPDGEFAVLRRHYGLWLPLSSFMASRLLFFVTASTVVLATSGFVFNEVFMASFPNFGFAFLVLGLVIIINLIGSSFSRIAQFFFVAVWLVAMLYLVAHGLFAEEHPAVAGQFTFSFRGLFLPFLLLIGVELALVQGQKNRQQLNPRLIGVGFLCLLLLLGLWGFTMGKMVSFDVLADSFIPHTKAARRLLGESGRKFIGVAMIAGSFALVNGLLQVLVTEVKGVAQDVFSKRWIESPFVEKAIVVVIGCSPGVMMAEGMAGYDITEVYLRGSLIFWLLHYGLMNRVVLHYVTGVFSILHRAALIFFGIVGVGLLYFDNSFVALCTAMGYVLLSTICSGLILSYFIKKNEILSG